MIKYSLYQGCYCLYKKKVNVRLGVASVFILSILYKCHTISPRQLFDPFYHCWPFYIFSTCTSLFTDNGPQYHNSAVLMYLAEVKAVFLLKLVEYNNFEAGEGKTVMILWSIVCKQRGTCRKHVERPTMIKRIKELPG